MPVQFRRDELPASDDDTQQTVVWKTDTSARFGYAAKAVCSGLWISIPGAAGLYLGLSLMKRVLLAAEALSKDNEYWRETWLPLLLFCFYGAILGAGITWRITSTVSLDELTAWLAAGTNIVLLLLVGVCSASLVTFENAVPFTCWTALALLGGAAVAGVYAVNAWND